MATAGDIITLALKQAGIIGVGQTAQAEDSTDCLTILNMMLSQWQKKRWLVYHLVDVSLNCTGAQSYTVGPGGDFDVARPDRLEAAFFRQIVQSQPAQIDYPLELLQSREDYNNIALKQLTSFPSYIFYDSAYPLGVVYPWPIPSNLYSLHLTIKETLQSFTNLTDTINLPPEYQAAILYNLSARIRPMYQLQPDPTITAMAEDALNVIRNANAQVPRLTMPLDLVRPGIYNPYSDQIR